MLCRYRAALAVLALLAPGCDDGPAPCSRCPVVEGSYVGTLQAEPAERSTCKRLFSSGGSLLADIFQSGSQLTMVGFFGSTGTLFEDQTASFGPVDFVVDTGEAARATMAGAFSGPEGARAFDGVVVASLKNEPCTLSMPVTLSQTGP